jgi:hypothetical protein
MSNQWKKQWQQKYPSSFANNYKIERYDKPLVFKSDSILPFASCPTPPAPTNEQLASAAAEIAKAMKIESCKTSTVNVQGEVDALFASASLNVNTSSAVGCDQVIAMANSYYQSQQNISCVLRQTATSNQTTVTGINSINITATDGDVYIEAPLTIDQKLKLTLVSLSQLSQEQKNEIAKTVKTTTDDIVKTLQDSKSGFGATPQGSKYISDTLSKIQNTNFDQSVSQTLNDITTSVQGGNTLNITGKNVRISKDTKFNQDLVLEIMATSILNDQITNTFNSMTEMTKKTTTDVGQKADNEGMPNLFEGRWVKYLMIGIALIVLFGGIGYAASKQDWGEISKNVAAAKTGGMGAAKTGGMGASMMKKP